MIVVKYCFGNYGIFFFDFLIYYFLVSLEKVLEIMRYFIFLGRFFGFVL